MCKKCKKLFSEAGNIRNYKIVCPHCNYIQKLNIKDSKNERTDKK